MTSSPKLTEAVVLALLRERLTDSGNGGAGAHAFMPHVAISAQRPGVAHRIIDALALNLYASRGFTLDAYEVKVSRNDWQRELGKPDKAADFFTIADRFWIVAPAGAVHDGELPPTWGLIEVRGDGIDSKPWKLRQKKAAPLLHDDHEPPPLPRGLIVSMMRAVPGAVPGGKNPAPGDEQLALARKQAEAKGIEEGRRLERRAHEADQRRLDAWGEFGEALLKASKHADLGWSPSPRLLIDRAPELVAAIASDDTHRRTNDALARVRRVLERALDVLPPADTEEVLG